MSRLPIASSPQLLGRLSVAIRMAHLMACRLLTLVVEEVFFIGLDGFLESAAAEHLGRFLYNRTDQFLPCLYRFFYPIDDPEQQPPDGHQHFNDTWWNGLPMDQHVNYVLEPTAFTELWIPLNYTPQVMAVFHNSSIDCLLSPPGPACLKTLYAVEFYGAMPMDAWLGQSSRWPKQA